MPPATAAKFQIKPTCISQQWDRPRPRDPQFATRACRTLPQSGAAQLNGLLRARTSPPTVGTRRVRCAGEPGKILECPASPAIACFAAGNRILGIPFDLFCIARAGGQFSLPPLFRVVEYTSRTDDPIDQVQMCADVSMGSGPVLAAAR